MTAPVTGELLDQLAALHAVGTPGTWSVYWGTRIGAGVVPTTPSGSGVTMEHSVAEVTDEDDRAVSDNGDNPASPQADAALIVAAVNATPALVGALRRVLDLAGKLDRRSADADRRVTGTHHNDYDAGMSTAYEAAAEDLRAALAGDLS